MKKIFYTFLLISPLLFISSCEEEDIPEVANLIGTSWTAFSPDDFETVFDIHEDLIVSEPNLEYLDWISIHFADETYGEMILKYANGEYWVITEFRYILVNGEVLIDPYGTLSTPPLPNDPFEISFEYGAFLLDGNTIIHNSFESESNNPSDSEFHFIITYHKE